MEAVYACFSIASTLSQVTMFLRLSMHIANKAILTYILTYLTHVRGLFRRCCRHVVDTTVVAAQVCRHRDTYDVTQQTKITSSPSHESPHRRETSTSD